MFSCVICRPQESVAWLISQDTLLSAGNDDSLINDNLPGQLLDTAARDKVIANFCNVGISSIVFRRGSAGCFHSYEDRITYTTEENAFAEAGVSSTGTRHQWMLPRYPTEIDEKHVREFVKIIPDLFKPSSRATIDQLGFTTADYTYCKSEIVKLEALQKSDDPQSGNLEYYYLQDNKLPDFQRIYQLLDAVKTLDEDVLDNFFRLGDLVVSTTSQHIAVDFINYDNQVLTVSTRFPEPDAFYMPWKIELDGHEYLSTSIQINHFIRKVYPKLLKAELKRKTIHEIVSYLYFSTNMAK